MTTSSDAEGSGRLLRRARLAALAVGGFLLPWCVLLAATLPATARVQDWWLAWTGLDGGEALAALSTAVLLARADARAALTAAAGGALLLADAWFDVCTSAGLDHTLAVADALFVEVPLACAAFWLAARLTGSSGLVRRAPQYQGRPEQAQPEQVRQHQAQPCQARREEATGHKAPGQATTAVQAWCEGAVPGQGAAEGLAAQGARAA
jgi:hypothetical protein